MQPELGRPEPQASDLLRNASGWLRELLRNLLLKARPEEFSAPARVSPIGAERGAARLALAPNVTPVELETARAEDIVVLAKPGGVRTVPLNPNQYAVIERLDGNTTVTEAVAEALKLGKFPAAIDTLLASLVRDGFLDDPSGLWASGAPDEDALRALGGRSRRLLARLTWRAEPLNAPARSLASLLQPLGGAAASVFGLFGALLIYPLGVMNFLGFAAGEGRTLIGEDEGLAAILLPVLITFYLAANLARLVQVSALPAAAANGGAASVAITAGLPMLRFDESRLRALPWTQAGGIRLSGTVLISLLGAFAMFALHLRPESAAPWALRCVGALLLYVFFAISPWWSSSLLRTMSQALPDIQLPWECWAYLWKRVLGLKPREESGPGDFLLSAYSLFMILWIAVLVRLATFLLRTEGFLVYVRAVRAGSTPGKLAVWVLSIGIALAFAALVGVVAFLAFRRLASAAWGESVRSRFGNPAALWAGVGLGVSASAYLLPAGPAAQFLALAVIVVAALLIREALRYFPAESRTFLSPAAAVLTVWVALVAVLRQLEVLAGAGEFAFSPDPAHVHPLWCLAGLALWGASQGTIRPALFSPGPAALAAVIAGLALVWIEPAPAIVVAAITVAAALFGLWAWRTPASVAFNFSILLAGAAGLLALSVARAAQTVGETGAAAPLFDLGFVAVALVGGAVALIAHAEQLATRSRRPYSPRTHDDRLVLAQSAGAIFGALQEVAAVLDGGRASAGVRAAAEKVARLVIVQDRGLDVRREPAPPLQELADEISQLFETALPLWFVATGRRTASLAFQHQYQALDWRARQLFDEHVLRRSGWPRLIAPVQADDASMDALQVLKACPTFAHFPEDTCERLARRLHLEFYRPGRTILRQGETGHCMYFVAHGSVEVIAETPTGLEKRLAVLREGMNFGQIALFYDMPRTATVRALSDLWVFRLDRADMEELAPPAAPGERAALGDLVSVVNRLFQVPLFREISHYDLEQLAQQSELIDVPQGEVVIREGDPGTDFFVIESGEVEVTQAGAVVARRGPGEYIGEIALLFAIPRVATVTAATPCRLIRVSGEAFRAVAAKGGLFQSSLLQTARRRMTAAE
jgi:CRP-like cAMP-binding protein